MITTRLIVRFILPYSRQVAERLAETTMDSSSKSGSKIVPDEERPTNTGSGSNEEDEDNAGYVCS